MNKQYPHSGHRKRLRDRFLQSGLEGFLDYEIVELLLTLGTPRRDCKQQAKAAIAKYGGLRGVLDASIDELQSIQGVGPSNAFGIKLFQAIALRYAREQIRQKISLTSVYQVANYFRERLGKEKKEHFMVLLLDSQNNFIRTEEISMGTLNQTLVHPREVFEPAMRYLAAKIIVAHNHPSGSLEPSDEDLRLTQRLISVGEITGIQVVDHIIVSSSGYVSLKEKRLM